ncbi:MAG: hypothetical protein F4X44_14160 [Gammaproteobacteria bacterium]|nr:hypothetical protein [Gammaproteobacteria bacterium]MYD81742.1 hypothetical protein [Gammaproteobacteria bacterium]
MLVRRSKAAQERMEIWQLRLAFAFGGYTLCVICPIVCYFFAYDYGQSHMIAGSCGLGFLLYGVFVLAICSTHKPVKDAVMWAFQIPRILRWIKGS